MSVYISTHISRCMPARMPITIRISEHMSIHMCIHMHIVTYPIVYGPCPRDAALDLRVSRRPSGYSRPRVSTWRIEMRIEMCQQGSAHISRTPLRTRLKPLLRCQSKKVPGRCLQIHVRDAVGDGRSAALNHCGCTCCRAC